MVEHVEELAIQSQFYAFRERKRLGEVEVTPQELRSRKALRPSVPNWQFVELSPPAQAPVLGSTAETKAFGLSHWIVPGCVTPQ